MRGQRGAAVRALFLMWTSDPSRADCARPVRHQVRALTSPQATTGSTGRAPFVSARRRGVLPSWSRLSTSQPTVSER